MNAGVRTASSMLSCWPERVVPYPPPPPHTHSLYLATIIAQQLNSALFAPVVEWTNTLPQLSAPFLCLVAHGPDTAEDA